MHSDSCVCFCNNVKPFCLYLNDLFLSRFIIKFKSCKIIRMPLPKRSSVTTTTKLVQESTPASKKRKQLKKNDSQVNETKRKCRKETSKKSTKIECKVMPDKTSTQSNRTKKNTTKSEENQNNSESEMMLMQSLPVDEMNVEQLLALGENRVGFNQYKEDDFENSSESEMSDFEEVRNAETSEPVIPKEGVNITLEVPGLYSKHKKKSFDWEAHLKRQMNRVRKDLQLLIHKVHVLCWIAHLRFVNNVLNNPTLLKSSASLIKSKNLYPSKYADLNYLEGILKWYNMNIEYKKDIVDPLCTGGLYEELKYQIEKKQAFTYRSFTFMFIILLRVLGLKARIIMSFQVLPVKPSLLELYSDVIKARSEKIKSQKAELLTEVKQSECQKSSKRKSIDDKQNDQKKKKHDKINDEKKPQTEEDNSDDEFKPENYRFSVKSAKKNVEVKLKKNKQSDLKPNSKLGSRKSNTNGKKQNQDCKDSEEDEDNDFTPVSLEKKNKKKRIDKESVSGIEDNQKKKEGINVWTEVYLEAEEKWISVDVLKQKIHCIGEIYSRASHPVTYIIACNNDHTLKDVTKRYVPSWHSDTRKRRVDEEWWNETMKPYLPTRTAQDEEEDEDINRQLLDKPLPSSISEFKDHPLYALKRHLLKFEAIYPPDAPTLGFVRGEPVYARECVHTLHSREMWYKQARLVRVKEEPYKIVKARPKYDKMSGEIKRDLPLELFGKWQTEDYIPPIATGGKVPRNEYGNVDLFKPCMLPIGTVHLQIPALNRVAKKLDIDCAPATVGFEFHSGGSHPVFDGFVICEEFKDILLDAWNKEMEESSKKEAEKREKRVFGNWKKLIRGLLIREKLKIKYTFGENSDEEDGSKVFNAKASTSASARNK